MKNPRLTPAALELLASGAHTAWDGRTVRALQRRGLIARVRYEPTDLYRWSFRRTAKGAKLYRALQRFPSELKQYI